MIRTRSIGTAVVLAVAMGLCALPASAFVHIGTPDLQLDDMDSGGKPQTLVISGLADIGDYAFDGSSLDIPFTLQGAGATVWLIIYTVDQNPPLTIEGEGPGAYADAERMDAGWHVYEGVDMLVYKSDGQRFDEGANVITWSGRDMDGAVVPAGDYDLFLAAFDDEATPHVVGPISTWCCNTGGLVINTARGQIADFLRLWQDNMENDWVGNIAGADPINNQSLIDACGDIAGCTTNYNAVTPLNDDLTEFIGSSWSGAAGMWISRFSYDWDTRQITLDEEWGADAGVENGMLMVGDILPPPGRMYQTATNPEKTVIWGTVGVSGIVSKIAAFDVETAEHLASMDHDLSEIFLYDNNGADRSAAPGTFGSFFDGNPDPYGLTMSGHHTSLIVRLDFDGNVKYINRNGDGFGDSKIFAEGVFGDLVYGHTEAPAFKYSASGTRWGWYAGLEAGTDALKNGFMLGEDGSGLFHFEPKNVPVTWPGKNIIVDEDGDWDGMYMTIGGIQTEAEANDWQPLPEPVNALAPLVQLPYDQKRVRLGETATAVSEIDGAVPTSSSLGDAYPNPFNPQTTIRFSLPWVAAISVDVYNTQGQIIRTLVDQEMGPGEFQVTWDGRDDHGAEVATGVYVYRITGPNLQLQKKVTFLK